MCDPQIVNLNLVFLVYVDKVPCYKECIYIVVVFKRKNGSDSRIHRFMTLVRGKDLQTCDSKLRTQKSEVYCSLNTTILQQI